MPGGCRGGIQTRISERRMPTVGISRLPVSQGICSCGKSETCCGALSPSHAKRLDVEQIPGGGAQPELFVKFGGRNRFTPFELRIGLRDRTLDVPDLIRRKIPGQLLRLVVHHSTVPPCDGNFAPPGDWPRAPAPEGGQSCPPQHSATVRQECRTSRRLAPRRPDRKCDCIFAGGCEAGVWRPMRTRPARTGAISESS
jgi:hypothetical protein